LQSEIQITESGPDHVTIESPTSYAGFVNFGTSRQSPQPYFTDAIENISSFDAVETIEEVVIDIWNEAVSRNIPR
jgi:HK97 gp10 family phage protein